MALAWNFVSAWCVKEREEAMTNSPWEARHKRHKAVLAQRVKKAVKDIEDRYKEDNPEAVAIATNAKIFVYTKRPKGFSNHPKIVAEWFATDRVRLRETNEQTAARLSAQFDDFKVPANLLTRKLPTKALQQVGDVLASHRKSVDLVANQTLSKIRKALLAKATADGGDRRYPVEITFTADAVVVGETRYPIQHHEKGYGRVRIGRQFLRCDVLEAMLRQS